jgi:hypothetical protein
MLEMFFGYFTSDLWKMFAKINYFDLDSLLYEVTNLIFVGCDALSWLQVLEVGRTW